MIIDRIITLWFPFKDKPNPIGGVSTWPNRMGFYAVICPKGLDRAATLYTIIQESRE